MGSVDGTFYTRQEPVYLSKVRPPSRSDRIPSAHAAYQLLANWERARRNEPLHGIEPLS